MDGKKCYRKTPKNHSKPVKFLTVPLDLIILSTIKEKSPRSIRDLANKINKDVGNIQPKIKKLADEGFIKFEMGPKNSKIPYLTYDEIKLEI